MLGITLLDLIFSFHLSKDHRCTIPTGIAVTALALTALASCREPVTARAGKSLPSPRTRLALAQVPADAQTILSLDVEHLRTLPAWKIMLAAFAKDPGHWLDGFMAGSGFDPAAQIRHVLLALPGERMPDKRFAVLADVNRMDEPRMSVWLRNRLASATAGSTAGATSLVRQHDPGDNQADDQLIFNRGAWTHLMAPLASTQALPTNALDDPDLRHLCAYAERGGDHDSREGVQDAPDLWLAAIVPASVRRSLMQDPRFSDAASVMRLSAFASFQAGLHAELVADLASTTDAVHLARRMAVYLNQAKRHPQVLLLGLAPYLEAVHLEPRRSRLHASLDLPLTQLADFVERIEALAHQAR